MEITLVRATIQDAENLWKMHIVAFQDLYAKYQDPETSPATETLEKTMTRLELPQMELIIYSRLIITALFT